MSRAEKIEFMRAHRVVWAVMPALLTVLAGPVHALDASALPPSCQNTLAQMRSDKGRFAGLGKAMTQARKASNINAFCMSAREIVVIIKAQSAQLDDCVGDLARGNVPEAAANQILALKSVYRQMLDAAKNGKNDRFKCGLADQ